VVVVVVVVVVVAVAVAVAVAEHFFRRAAETHAWFDAFQALQFVLAND
jgi:threonine/homoserine/homoserine lactone efflux protein